MKVIHIASKALLKVVELAVIAVVIVSVIPLVAGGLTIDNEPEATMEVNPDGYTVTIKGSVDVSSSLMWDINDISYYVSVGDENVTVARSDPVLTSIPKSSSATLEFSIEVPIINLSLYMLDSGLDTSGNMSTMKVPIQFGIGGYYIQNLIGFDLDVGLDVTMDTGLESTVDVSDNGDHIEMEIKYTAGTELPIGDMDTIKFEIRSNVGTVSGEVGIGDDGSVNSLSFILDGAGVNVRDIINGDNLEVFVDNEGTWSKIPITFNSTMVVLLNSILDKLGVPE